MGASRLPTLGFRTVLEELIMIGGDTDTIASMAGQIMGCVLGRDRIPEDLVVRVPRYDHIIQLASDLAESIPV